MDLSVSHKIGLKSKKISKSVNSIWQFQKNVTWKFSFKFCWVLSSLGGCGLHCVQSSSGRIEELQWWMWQSCMKMIHVNAVCNDVDDDVSISTLILNRKYIRQNQCNGFLNITGDTIKYECMCKPQRKARQVFKT